MAARSPLEVARWVLGAGWSGPDAITATAIALRTGADPDTPRGLFGLGTAGDGPAQAAVARQRQKTQGWTVFPAYRDRSYLLLVPVATGAVGAAAATVVGGNIANTAQDAAQAPLDAAQALGDLSATAGRLGGFLADPGAWQRIAKIGIGASLIVVAALYLGKRLTVDQGVRAVRALGNDVARGPGSVVLAGRNMWGAVSRGASKAVTAGAPDKPSPAPDTPKTEHVGKHRREEKGPVPWSEYPTEPRPQVPYRGVARRRPVKVGTGEKTKTAAQKRSAS